MSESAAAPDEIAALIATLGLQPHPEGGFYSETFRAREVVTVDGRRRATSTAIYFLLPAGSFSAFHRVLSDEAWHHYAGDPLELHTLSEDRHGLHRLGSDLASGERPQFVVPAGVLQAARPLGRRWTLCGCTVCPGFDFADFTMPTRAELVDRYPAHAALIAELTRS